MPPILKKRFLKFEPVPESCWMNSVRSACSDLEWWMRFERDIKASARNCAICRNVGPMRNLEIHERWSYTLNGDHYFQTLEGFDVLCPACHEVCHFAVGLTNGRLVPMANHLKRVNKWTDDEVREHITEALKTWAERNEWEWKLDLDWLRRREPRVPVSAAGKPADMGDLQELDCLNKMYRTVVTLGDYKKMMAQAHFDIRYNVTIDQRS